MANTLQAVGTLMNFSWVSHGSVHSGPLCSAQGVFQCAVSLFLHWIGFRWYQASGKCGDGLVVVHDCSSFVQPAFPTVEIYPDWTDNYAYWWLGLRRSGRFRWPWVHSISRERPLFWSIGCLVLDYRRVSPRTILLGILFCESWHLRCTSMLRITNFLVGILIQRFWIFPLCCCPSTCSGKLGYDR